jgi:DnaJ homolog subfamily C member 19
MMKWVVAALFIWLVWTLMRKPARGVMSLEEADARRLLGVGPRADHAAIRAAHRRLVADAHPDRGGGDDLARQLNAARDLLIGRRPG